MEGKVHIYGCLNEVTHPRFPCRLILKIGGALGPEEKHKIFPRKQCFNKKTDVNLWRDSLQELLSPLSDLLLIFFLW